MLHKSNVALTRARKKFIFVASILFFQAFPMTEKALITQIPFDKLQKIPGVKLLYQDSES